jgi:hypothetical protein
MKRLLVLLSVLFLLPSVTAWAEEQPEKSRKTRGQRAVPGPQVDMESLCDRLLESGPGAFYMDSDERENERESGYRN